MQNAIQWDSLYHIMSRCSRCTYSVWYTVNLVRNLFHSTIHSLAAAWFIGCYCFAHSFLQARCWFVLPIWHIRRWGACSQAHCKKLKMDRNSSTHYKFGFALTFCERCELWMHNDQEITMMYLRLFRALLFKLARARFSDSKKNVNRLKAHQNRMVNTKSPALSLSFFFSTSTWCWCVFVYLFAYSFIANSRAVLSSHHPFVSILLKSNNNAQAQLRDNRV